MTALCLLNIWLPAQAVFFAQLIADGNTFTADLKGDIGLSSAINSMSILISICCIVAVVAVVL